MTDDPFRHNALMEALHREAPIRRNFEILFRDLTVAGYPFLDLYEECMVRSGTQVGDWKVFRRALRALHLAKYYEYALGLDGARAECGVLMGFSALMLARIQELRDPASDGAGLHLVDSFEGLSRPGEADAVAMQEVAPGRREPVYSHQRGHFAVPLEAVRRVMAPYPGVALHKGWIPEVLETLPDRHWSFVHIDVDLYEPTLGCLDYFMPRLAPGGCIVNDDFASPLFPGGGRAWTDYFGSRNLSYVVLDSGQSVYINA